MYQTDSLQLRFLLWISNQKYGGINFRITEVPIFENNDTHTSQHRIKLEKNKPFQVLAGFCSFSQSLGTFLWLLRREKNWRRSFPDGTRRHLKMSNLICVKRSLLTQITRKLKREQREHPLSVLHSRLILYICSLKNPLVPLVEFSWPTKFLVFIAAHKREELCVLCLEIFLILWALPFSRTGPPDRSLHECNATF